MVLLFSFVWLLVRKMTKQTMDQGINLRILKAGELTIGTSPDYHLEFCVLDEMGIVKLQEAILSCSVYCR